MIQPHFLTVGCAPRRAFSYVRSILSVSLHERPPNDIGATASLGLAFAVELLQ